LLYIAGTAHTYERLTPRAVVEAVEAAGAAAYVLIGAAMLLGGGAFLANRVPLGPPATLRSGGTIALLNAATGLAVAGGFVLLITAFVEEALAARRDD
jgi:multicomponent Na+:H+ antiporter subunit B